MIRGMNRAFFRDPLMASPDTQHGPNAWDRLREALLNPRVDPEKLNAILHEARARQPLPVLWLLGKAQAGKTSIIRALTGSAAAEIGNGFQPCTRHARFYDFPDETPVVRFLDTRGLGEVAYDPAEDIRYCESQAHLMLGVIKVADIRQDEVFKVLRQIRKRHPEWPVLMIQTGLHEAYPPGAEHILPYPYEQQPWPLSIPHDLIRALHAQRDRLGSLPGSAPVRWVAIDLTLPEDGWEPVHYGLEALWTAIGEVSALGLQTRLRGDPGVRDTYARAAYPQIVGHALAAAGIGALPMVDLVGVPAIQAKLLHGLATLHEQNWDRRTVSEFLGLLGIGVGANYVTRLLGREAVKLIPGWGQTVGAMWGATASGATTYALGQAASAYFVTRRHGDSVDAAAIRRIYTEALATGVNILKSSSKV